MSSAHSVAAPVLAGTLRPAQVLRRMASTATAVLLWALLGAIATLTVATTAPAVLGYRAFNVLSGSMTPTLGVGSVVIDQRIRALDARPGDIVTFPSPDDRTRLITHRVRHISLSGGRAYLVTRGDANPTGERWNVPLDAEIGRVVLELPKLGYARAWAAGRGGGLVVMATVLLWGVLALRHIWRPERTPPGESKGAQA